MATQLIFRLICISSLIVSPLSKATEDAQAAQKLVIPHQVETTNHIHFYIVKVLTRVLEITEQQYGPFELVSQASSTVQARQLRNLEQGLSDIVWMISTTQRDANAQPVRIPLIGGLYGYRVLLVREQTSEPFPLAKLRKMTYTQGPDWPDFEILRANQLNVQPSPYKAGFRLVRDGFVDAYPRAVHEAKLELKRDIARDLRIAPDILLVYDNPLFFYVADTNVALAKRIEQGLTMLIERGELQRLLKAQPFYAAALKAMQGRTAFELENPYLSLIAKEAMEYYLAPSEALSYATDVTTPTSCNEDKQPAQC